MPHEFDAVYENGILRPIGPLPFAEHETVRLFAARQDGEDRAATLAAIRAGLDDLDAGRTEPFEEFDREMRSKLGLSPRP
jgi:predicted DNA-binding antitoxin AbrB/MazE fold protein